MRMGMHPTAESYHMCRNLKTWFETWFEIWFEISGCP
jgi:hypothetical protein